METTARPEITPAEAFAIARAHLARKAAKREAELRDRGAQVVPLATVATRVERMRIDAVRALRNGLESKDFPARRHDESLNLQKLISQSAAVDIDTRLRLTQWRLPLAA